MSIAMCLCIHCCLNRIATTPVSNSLHFFGWSRPGRVEKGGCYATHGEFSFPSSNMTLRLVVMESRSDAMQCERGHHDLVGLPAVRELRWHRQVHRVGRRMAVQEVGDSFAGDDDACLPVAGGEYAQPPGLQVERGGVAAAGQRMYDDDDLELAALQPVGCVDCHAWRVRLPVRVSATRTRSAWSRWATPMAMSPASRTRPLMWRSQVATAPRSSSR